VDIAELFADRRDLYLFYGCVGMASHTDIELT